MEERPATNGEAGGSSPSTDAVSWSCPRGSDGRATPSEGVGRRFDSYRGRVSLIGFVRRRVAQWKRARFGTEKSWVRSPPLRFGDLHPRRDGGTGSAGPGRPCALAAKRRFAPGPPRASTPAGNYVGSLRNALRSHGRSARFATDIPQRALRQAIGRHPGLRSQRPRGHGGSNPSPGNSPQHTWKVNWSGTSPVC